MPAMRRHDPANIGRAGVGRKGQPWKLDAAFMQGQYERARKAAEKKAEKDRKAAVIKP